MANKIFTYHLRSVPVAGDGDTLNVVLDRGERDYSERNVRLVGLDTPETHTKNLTEKKCGLKVKDIVQKWLAAHPNCVFHACQWKEQEKYGRFLGDFVDGKESLCKFLLINKLARPYNGEAKVEWTPEQFQLIEDFKG